MSLQNAREFLDYVGKNPELAEKFKGFTLEELRQALEEVKLSADAENKKPNQAMPILPI
ncbi:hypothetical protein CLHUN_10520 [Ruminiclostridium hungatei]|uniref:Nif11 domain-containing protein n=1 Tax=Ruminiclostridium hungatei TaxID=48256 RepID=A0A1V4SNX2_RUMHU|nr:Nif11 family protein [Ruminiclostridium hungatei]OPX45165.1 hypothetical protein CLHUN_10520 [Ruminiclostridium hungatei]